MSEKPHLKTVLKHPFFWVSLVFLIIAVVWVVIPTGSNSADQLDALKLVKAIDQYKVSLQNAGKEIPVEMELQELVRHGLLSNKDLGMFADLQSSVYLRPTNSPAVLMRAILQNGEAFYLLDDGSVQWLPADQAL